MGRKEEKCNDQWRMRGWERGKEQLEKKHKMGRREGKKKGKRLKGKKEKGLRINSVI